MGYGHRPDPSVKPTRARRARRGQPEGALIALRARRISACFAYKNQTAFCRPPSRPRSEHSMVRYLYWVPVQLVVSMDYIDTGYRVVGYAVQSTGTGYTVPGTRYKLSRAPNPENARVF